jgi:hypothetical protein
MLACDVCESFVVSEVVEGVVSVVLVWRGACGWACDVERRVRDAVRVEAEDGFGVD